MQRFRSRAGGEGQGRWGGRGAEDAPGRDKAPRPRGARLSWLLPLVAAGLLLRFLLLHPASAEEGEVGRAARLLGDALPASWLAAAAPAVALAPPPLRPAPQATLLSPPPPQPAAAKCRTCEVASELRFDARARRIFEEIDDKPDKALFATFGSESMRDFVVNWFAQTRKVLPAQAAVMGALDAGAERICEEHQLPCIAFGANVRMNTSGAYWRQNEATFLYMANLKADLLVGLLSAGWNVWMSDLDVAWLGSPWGWSGGTAAAVVPEAWELQYADVIPSTDIITLDDEKKGAGWLVDRECNTGTIFWRNTSAAIALAKQWKLRLWEERNHSYKNDQATFNRMFDGGSVQRFTPPAPAPDPGVVRGVFRRKGPNLGSVEPLFGTTSMTVFMNGHGHAVSRLHELYGTTPITAHITYIFSDEPRYSFGKRHRLRQMHAWNDPPSYYAGKFLALSPELVSLVDDQPYNQSEVGPTWVSWDANLNKPNGIALHLRMNDVQRFRLRNLFLLGRSTGRIVVLPHMFGFCERHFWLLEGCRVAGNTMSLPRTMPLDHFFEIGRFYDAQIDFREADFLANPKFDQQAADVRYVTLADVDAFCVDKAMPASAIETVERAMAIGIKFCGHEDWYIPPGGHWDHVRFPLNCSHCCDTPSPPRPCAR